MKAELIEALAAIEHERWSGWQKYLHSQGERVLREGRTLCAGMMLDGGDLILPADLVEHWERLVLMPYDQLEEHSKQADRDEVMKCLPVIVEAIAEWLGEALYGMPETKANVIREWREEWGG